MLPNDQVLTTTLARRSTTVCCSNSVRSCTASLCWWQLTILCVKPRHCGWLPRSIPIPAQGKHCSIGPHCQRVHRPILLQIPCPCNGDARSESADIYTWVPTPDKSPTPLVSYRQTHYSLQDKTNRCGHSARDTCGNGRSILKADAAWRVDTSRPRAKKRFVTGRRAFKLPRAQAKSEHP